MDRMDHSDTTNKAQAEQGRPAGQAANAGKAGESGPAAAAHPGSGDKAGEHPAPARRAAPGHSAQGRHGSSGDKGSWKKDVLLLAVGGALVCVLALLLEQHWNNAAVTQGQSSGQRTVTAIAEIYSDGPLRINEIMSSNHSTLAVEDGSSPDWVEVINIGEHTVDLNGYALSKTDSGTGVFTFPEMELEPQQCALVYADSKLRTEAGGALHAPFRISSSGDTLMLFNTSGTAIDTVNIPALVGDQSYVREGREQWTQSSAPTPGLPNTQDSVQQLSTPIGAGDVVLSELVASNDSALADEDGLYYDYIELSNRTDREVDLAGWYLSDDAAQPRKWRFPSVHVAPGSYLLVFASGLNRQEDPTHLHTNFSLSSEGEQVVLSDAGGRMRECIDFDLLKSDQAWALGADGNWKLADPSPGAANP